MDELDKYIQAVRVLDILLSEFDMETLNDAIQCYGRHPEDHTCEDDMGSIKKLASAFDRCGYNLILPEYDILRK